jgi:hypothetical protein
MTLGWTKGPHIQFSGPKSLPSYKGEAQTSTKLDFLNDCVQMTFYSLHLWLLVLLVALI